MALKKTTCINHPDRQAIGVCVITRKPICSECSTQYEGVNYSKEGLEILLARRASKPKAGFRDKALRLFTLAISPLFIYLLYLAYLYMFEMFMDITQRGM